MDKEKIEQILVEYGVSFTDALADRLMKEFKPCEDVISRDELLKAIDTWDKFGYTTQYGLERLDKDDKDFVPYVKYDDVIKCIKGIPPVKQQESITDRVEYGTDGNAYRLTISNGKELKQEPKTGHWIRMKAYEKWGCSECSTVFRFTFKEHDYCPNCGCRMIEP